MQVLTPTGYKDIAACSVGDEVCAFDLATGAPIVNTIESIQPVDVAEFRRWQNPRVLINGEERFGAHYVLTWFGVKRVDQLSINDVIREGDLETSVSSIQFLDDVPSFDFYRINDTWTLFCEQSIWFNGASVKHARDLIVGDVIHDDQDRDVIVTSIERVDQALWYRLEVSGDHSFISDGLTLHNASRFWVGGTGTWDGVTTTHWSATTGGAGGASVPVAADFVTFDGASGGGTVTVNTTVSVQSITYGAFIGTLDFSVNNNNVTMPAQFNGGGTATRTFNMGNGTWTLNSSSTSAQTFWLMTPTTGQTFNANLSSIVIAVSGSSSKTFSGGGVIYNSLTVNAHPTIGSLTLQGFNTFSALTVNGPNYIVLQQSGTQTVATLVLLGSSGNDIGLVSTANYTAATVSVASGLPTMSWVAIKDITFTGGATFAATSSSNLGNNTGIAIAPPPPVGPVAQRLLIQRGTPY